MAGCARGRGERVLESRGVVSSAAGVVVVVVRQEYLCPNLERNTVAALSARPEKGSFRQFQNSQVACECVHRNKARRRHG